MAETKAGQVDDNAAKRAKDRKEAQKKALQAIFDDNTTGRSGPTVDK